MKEKTDSFTHPYQLYHLLFYIKKHEYFIKKDEMTRGTTFIYNNNQ